MTDEGSEKLPVSECHPIIQLPPEVVNRIAAGEVVVRPSAALKELLENSLDAGATSITVTVRGGGLKVLQVCDNGKGISKEDLPLLCQRFATSKLRVYEDLATVSTFGFRGEALASISHVSRLSVLTKTAESNVAFKAQYADGILKGEPEAAAGVVGTTMTVEDMFYNLIARQSALRPTDEYRAIVDVVARYSLRYSQVAFICRRNDAGKSARLVSASDVRTEVGASIKDNICAAFGKAVANELLFFEVEIPDAKATISACVTSANFSMKKHIFVLFINGRLVECFPFKRAIAAAYSCYLPKGGCPFTYVDLRMDQADIDVNVHPTKKEVRFLHEDVIVEAVIDHLMEKLKTAETSRTFHAQSILTNSGPKLKAHLPTVESELSCEDDDRLSYLGRPQRSKLRTTSEKLRDSKIVSDAIEDNGENGHVALAQSHEEENAQDEGKGDNAIENESGGDVEIKDKDENEEIGNSAFYGKDGSESEFRSLNSQGTEHGRANSTKLYEDGRGPPTPGKRTIYQKNKVRTSSNAPVGLFDVYLARDKEKSAALSLQNHRKRSANAIPMLTSVENMLKEAETVSHKGLTQVLRDHIFVGVASTMYVLLQHTTKLLLAEIDPLITELMYQQVLVRFADHETFYLDPPAPLMGLIDGYLENMGDSPLDMRIDAESCATILLEKASMLSEYFGLSIKGAKASDANIECLPLLVPGIMPDMRCFGHFLYQLAVNTDWSEEWNCLKGVANCIAEWYGKHWVPISSEEADVEDNEEGDDRGITEPSSSAPSGSNRETEQREWLLRHVLFASLRKDFYPPRRFYVDQVIRELTSTAKLYKIFERC